MNGPDVIAASGFVPVPPGWVILTAHVEDNGGIKTDRLDMVGMADRYGELAPVTLITEGLPRFLDDLQYENGVVVGVYGPSRHDALERDESDVLSGDFPMDALILAGPRFKQVYGTVQWAASTIRRLGFELRGRPAPGSGVSGAVAWVMDCTVGVCETDRQTGVLEEVMAECARVGIEADGDGWKGQGTNAAKAAHD